MGWTAAADDCRIVGAVARHQRHAGAFPPAVIPTPPCVGGTVAAAGARDGTTHIVGRQRRPTHGRRPMGSQRQRGWPCGVSTQTPPTITAHAHRYRPPTASRPPPSASARSPSAAPPHPRSAAAAASYAHKTECRCGQCVFQSRVPPRASNRDGRDGGTPRRPLETHRPAAAASSKQERGHTRNQQPRRVLPQTRRRDGRSAEAKDKKRAKRAKAPPTPRRRVSATPAVSRHPDARATTATPPGAPSPPSGARVVLHAGRRIPPPALPACPSPPTAVAGALPPRRTHPAGRRGERRRPHRAAASPCAVAAAAPTGRPLVCREHHARRRQAAAARGPSMGRWGNGGRPDGRLRPRNPPQAPWFAPPPTPLPGAALPHHARTGVVGRPPPARPTRQSRRGHRRPLPLP